MAPLTSLSLGEAKAREDLLYFFGSEKASCVKNKLIEAYYMILSCDHLQYEKPLSEE